MNYCIIVVMTSILSPRRGYIKAHLRVFSTPMASILFSEMTVPYPEVGEYVYLFEMPYVWYLLTFSDEFCDIEVTGFDVIASNTRARFFVVYRPPKQDVDAVKYMKKLVKCLSNYESKKYTNMTYS